MLAAYLEEWPARIRSWMVLDPLPDGFMELFNTIMTCTCTPPCHWMRVQSVPCCAVLCWVEWAI